MIDFDRERANMLKRVRSEVRLKHSLEADDELRVVLPVLTAEFERALQDGVVLELQPGTLAFYHDE
jgi:hypothetical protein